MDFALTAEQEQLRDTLRCFVTREYGFDRRRAIAASPEGMSPEIWHQFAELGLLALGIPEALGGLGGGPVDTMLVMEELGRGLVLEPYLSTAVLGTRLLVDSGSAAQHSALLAPVAAGRCRDLDARNGSGRNLSRTA